LKDLEHREQVAYMRWLALQHPRVFAVTTAVPLGGLRGKVTGRRLKTEGVKAGYPDILIDFPLDGWHGLRIEMKRQGATASAVTPSQRVWLKRLTEQGYAVGWAAGFALAMELTTLYIKGDFITHEWLEPRWLQ